MGYVTWDHFDGRTAIVTGGARGIGEATGRRLVADGASVISFDQSAPQSPVGAKGTPRKTR
ncbi:MAG: SDR family NAD(P)-dependent oxidoreductase, partial [Chloroflexi bacterium]|nr:SDR family NAD(P)-dependent oxidoreductase [Chloroflexota bacterium]